MIWSILMLALAASSNMLLPAAVLVECALWCFQLPHGSSRMDDGLGEPWECRTCVWLIEVDASAGIKY